jgi:hypothetical protein
VKRITTLALAALLGLCAGMALAEDQPRSTQLTWSSGNLLIEDSVLSASASIWDDCPLLAINQDPTIGLVWDEPFISYVTTQGGLTSTATEGGSAAGGAGGYLTIVAGNAGDNDEIYVGGTHDVFTPAAGRDLWFEARAKLTEANTDDANIVIGLSTIYSADFMQDDGAGPAADYDGLIFFKVDGGTVWQTESSTSTSQTTNASAATFTSGSWVRLGIFLEGITQATFYVDGTSVGSVTVNLPDTAFSPVIGAKNGDTNDETLYVDWFKAVQLN